MKMMILSVALSAVVATPSLAQEPVQSPTPTADAPLEERSAWCDEYVARLLAQETQRPGPDDIRAAQHEENERRDCAIDPALYERMTQPQQ